MKTAEQAARMGYTPLAGPYFDGEEWMRKRVEEDMVEGKIAYLLVEEEGGISIWRK